MKLKTLKDLKGISFNGREKQVENYLKDLLKAEAVKWRKHFKIMDERVFDEFFNLTEEN